MKKVILIAGNKRAGKDFTANELRRQLEQLGHTVQLLAFATPMKQLIASTFGITLDELERAKNRPEAHPILMKGITESVLNNQTKTTNFREILQRFGTEAMKPIFGEDVWANLTLEETLFSDADYVIIPDLRFELEYMVFLKTFNRALTTIQVLGGEQGDDHLSEQPLNIAFDYILDNTEKSPQLILDISKIIGDLK